MCLDHTKEPTSSCHFCTQNWLSRTSGPLALLKQFQRIQTCRVISEVGGTLTVKHDITSLTEREKMRRLALFMLEDNRQPVIEGSSQAVPDAMPAKTSKTLSPDQPVDDDAPA